MSNQTYTSKRMNIALWIAQSVLAAALMWAGIMKLSQPIEELSSMWPWTGQVHAGIVKLTGILDLSGKIGLIMPALLHVKPKLTPIAAIAVVVLMICAGIFHIWRGEASSIGVNLVFALMAGFVAWGRL